MTWARPDLLALVFALPLLVLLTALGYARRRRRAVEALGDVPLIGRLAGPLAAPVPAWRIALLTLAALSIGIAAAGPQWGMREVEGRVTGRDVVIVLDVSRSMLVRDLTPNRLERQRLLARQIMRELEGSRIGLVAFAGRAYVLSPLTVDRAALELYLDAVDPELASEGGSSLAAAIRQGTDLATQSVEERGGDRAVILVSDGEAHEDEEAVMAAAARAARAGVTIHTVVVGTAQGGPVPVEERDGTINAYVRYEGEVVVSRANGDLLRRIADETGGKTFRLEQPGGAAAEVAAAVRGGASAAGEVERRLEPRNQFRWFAALALVLIAWDAVLMRMQVRGEPATRATAVAGAAAPEVGR